MLTKKAKYALKALIYISEHPGRQISAREIAKETSIPYKFLEAILSELKHHSVVNSRRGMDGGFTLSQDPSKIMIGDIVRIIDGPLAPLQCASLTHYKRCDDCLDEDACGLHHVMMEARLALSAVFDKTSLYNIAEFEFDHEYPSAIVNKGSRSKSK